MVTKELKKKKYCCFYVSDFHLEMILLHYIKSNINNTNFIIYTQYDLQETVKTVLDKTNFTLDEKNKILGLNWNNKNIKNLTIDKSKDYTIIINGDCKYILKVKHEIEVNNLNIIDCYNIEKEKLNLLEIKKNYDDILNTKNKMRLS